MIPDFSNSYHCQSHSHCVVCLSEPLWRKSVGAPDVCPWGMTMTKAEKESKRIHIAVSNPATDTRPRISGCCDPVDTASLTERPTP